MMNTVQGVADRVAAQVNVVVDRVNALPQAGLNRFIGAAVGIPTSVVLGIAAWLTPSPAGHGTHTQLGLGTCTLLTITGWPCPMCGMTTTFSLLAHGRLVDAFFNQPFGLVLFSITVLGASIGLSDLLTGRGLWRVALRKIQRHEQIFAIVLLVGMIVGWLYKCVIMHPEVIS